MRLRGSAGKALRVAVDWAPFLAVYLVFESLRGLVPSIALRIDARTPLVVEERLFGAPLSLIMYHYRSAIVDAVSSVVYALHPVDALLLAVVLYLHRRETYYRFVAAFTVVSGVGLLLYFAWPVAPPWMVLPGTRVPNYLTRLVSLLKGGGAYGDPNPFAAMPSLHMALAVLVAYHLYKSYRSRWVRGLAVLWPCAMLFSIIYTGNHYVLDAVVGVIVGVAGLKAGNAYSGRMEAFLGLLASRGTSYIGSMRRYLAYPLHGMLRHHGGLDIADAKDLVISRHERSNE